MVSGGFGVEKQHSEKVREQRMFLCVGQPCAREFLSSSAEGPKGP